MINEGQHATAMKLGCSSGNGPLYGGPTLGDHSDVSARDGKGAPDTFDVAGYVSLLDRIRHQFTDSTMRAPRYDRAASTPVADAIEIDGHASLVITEGNYLLVDAGRWSAVRPLRDEVWYVEVSDDVRVSRLIARHIGFGKSPDEAREWVLRSDEMNAALVASTRSRADAVVRLS